MDDFQRSRLSDVRPEPEADISSDGRSSHGYGDVLSLLRMPDGSHYDLQEDQHGDRGQNGTVGEECWGNTPGDTSCDVRGDAAANLARVASPLRLRRTSRGRDVPAGEQQPLLQLQHSAGHGTSSQSQHFQDVGASFSPGGQAADNAVTIGSSLSGNAAEATPANAPAIAVPFATSTTAAPRMRLQEARAAAWASRQERAGSPPGSGIQDLRLAPLSPPVSSPTTGSPPGSNNSKNSDHSDSVFLDFLREHGRRQEDVASPSSGSPPSGMGLAEGGNISAESSALLSEGGAYIAGHVLPASRASSASGEAREDILDEEELPPEHRDEEEGPTSQSQRASESRTAAARHRALPYGYSGRPQPRNERPPPYDPGTPRRRQHHISAPELPTAVAGTGGPVASTATNTMGPLPEQHGVPETPTRQTGEADVPMIAFTDGEWEVPLVIQADAVLQHPEPTPADVLPLPKARLAPAPARPLAPAPPADTEPGLRSDVLPLHRARLPEDTEPGQTWLPGNSPERWRNSLRPRFSDTMRLGGAVPASTVVSAAESLTGPEEGEEERSSLIHIQPHFLPQNAGDERPEISELQDATQQAEGGDETNAAVVQISRRNSRVSWASGASMPLVLGDVAPPPRAETSPAATDAQTQIQLWRPGDSIGAARLPGHAGGAPGHPSEDSAGSTAPPLPPPALAPAAALPLETAEPAPSATITPARRRASRTSLGRASEMTEFLSCEEPQSGTVQNPSSMQPPPQPPLTLGGATGSDEGGIHATPASWGEFVIDDAVTFGRHSNTAGGSAAPPIQEGRPMPQGPRTEGLMPPARFHSEGSSGVTDATLSAQQEPTAYAPRTEGPPLPHALQQQPLQHLQHQQRQQQQQQQTARFGPPAAGHFPGDIPQSVQLEPGSQPQHARPQRQQQQQQQEQRFGLRTEGPLPTPAGPQGVQPGPGDVGWQPLHAHHQHPHPHQPQPPFWPQQQQQQRQQQQQMGPRTEGPLPPPENNMRTPAANAFGVGQASWGAAVDDAGVRPASWGNVGDISQIPVAPQRRMGGPFMHDPPFMPQATGAVFAAALAADAPPFRPQAMALSQPQHHHHRFPLPRHGSSGPIPQSENVDFQMPGAMPQVQTSNLQLGADHAAGLHARQFWGRRTEGPLPPPEEHSMPGQQAEAWGEAEAAGQQSRPARRRRRRKRRRGLMRPPRRSAAHHLGPGQVEPGLANVGGQIASGSADIEAAADHMELSDTVLAGRSAELPVSHDQQEQEEPQVSGRSELLGREERQVPQPSEHPEQNEVQELPPAAQQGWEEPQASGQAERLEQVEQLQPPLDALTLEPLEPVPPAMPQAATDRIWGLEAATQSEQLDGRPEASGLPAAAAPVVEVAEAPLAGGAVRGEPADSSRAIVAMEVKTTPDKLPARRPRERLERPPKGETFELTEVGLERFGAKGSARRPTRRIVQPLKHWLNEQVLYERKAHSALPTVVAVQLAKPTSKTVEDVCPQLLALCDAQPLSPLQNLELPEDSPVSRQQHLLSPPLPPPPLGPSSPSEPCTPTVAPRKAANRVTAASARSGGFFAQRRRPASSNNVATVHTKARPSSGGAIRRRPQSSGVGTVASSADSGESGSVRKVARRGAAAVAVECAPAGSARGSKPTSQGRQRVAGSHATGTMDPHTATASARCAGRSSTIAKTPAASIRSGTSETGAKRSQKTSNRSIHSGVPGRGRVDHNDLPSRATAKRRRLDPECDAPSETEAAEAEPNQAVVPLADGFVRAADDFLRAPTPEGSLHGCEIRVGTHVGPLMCVDLMIPPRSHNHAEIVSDGKTLQMLVQKAEPGALFADVDGHHFGLDVDDNLIVRSGQEYCLRNNSEVELARLKMVLLVTDR